MLCLHYIKDTISTKLRQEISFVEPLLGKPESPRGGHYVKHQQLRSDEDKLDFLPPLHFQYNFSNSNDINGHIISGHYFRFDPLK